MRILLGVAVLAMLAAPVWANMLSATDGGFEDPWTDGAPDWYSQKTGGLIERDSGIFGPGAPHGGSHYGSLQTGGNTDHAAWITIDASGAMVLDGWAAGGTNNAAATVYVQLIDGDQNGAVLGTWSYNMPVTQGFGWTALTTLSGNATSGKVTVKIGYDIISGWSNGTAIHVDDLVLTPEPAGLALLSLLGIPLLRRRRA